MPNQSAPLIKVNTDPPTKLAKLYGIGSERASRIVTYRRSQPIRGPEDLANASGISLNHAITLASQIDFTFPQKPERPRRRDWLGFFVSWILIPIFVLIYLAVVVPTAGYYLGYHQGERGFEWIYPWLFLVAQVFLGAAIAYGIASTVMALTTSRKRRRKHYRIALVSGAVLFLSLAMILALSSSTWVSNPDEAERSRTTLELVYLAFVFLSFFLWLAPRLWLVLRPESSNHGSLRRINDIAIVIGGPIFAVGNWVFRDTIPPIAKPFLLGAGLWLTYLGYQSLRFHKSFFYPDLIVEPEGAGRKGSLDT